MGALALLVAAIGGWSTGFAETSRPADADAIQERMQGIIEYLDSPAYAQRVSWSQHIVLSYRLVQGRDPSALELYLLSAYRADIGLKRSEAVSIALRGDELGPTWEQTRRFARSANLSEFRARPSVVEAARRLAVVRRPEILAQLRDMVAESGEAPCRQMPLDNSATPNVQYQTYFGYLHAHSELSDGEGSALEAYRQARDLGELDFFALTDHGELLAIWPWESNWDELRDAAEATYEPGSYATLWGFEWSNPILGHLNVLNTEDFTHSLARFRLSAIYDWITDRPMAFARFNHPGDYDYLLFELAHLRLAETAVPQIVGVETWNGGDSFDRYLYAGSWARLNPFSEYSYWDAGNLRGWYLGPVGGQDNHSPNWGTRNQFRTAVLAESLTREDIVDAYRNRRYYATEDKDLYLDFRAQGFPMGSRLTNVPRELEVSATDGSGDSFSEIWLYRNGNLLQTQPVSGNVVQAVFTDPMPVGADYYYVIVRQNDDNDGNGRPDEAVSAPIWIE